MGMCDQCDGALDVYKQAQIDNTDLKLLMIFYYCKSTNISACTFIIVREHSVLWQIDFTALQR